MLKYILYRGSGPPYSTTTKGYMQKRILTQGSAALSSMTTLHSLAFMATLHSLASHSNKQYI